MPHPLRAPFRDCPDTRLLDQPAELPVGTALDLARVPIVLATVRRGGPRELTEHADSDTRERDALSSEPVLPREFWQREIRLRDRTQRETIVTVEGHPSLGLAFGADYDVLLGLFTIAQQDRERVRRGLTPRVQVDGEFTGITVLDIALAMGYERTQVQGALRTRIRSALRRFAYTRLTTRSHVLYDGSDLAAVMRVDGVSPDHAPVVPERERRFTATEESVTWLLEYKWRVDHTRGTPEVWIQRLRLNPIFLDQVATGWIAWIDPDRYSDLKSALARRLYTIYAADVAFGEGDRSFEHSIESLAARVGLPPGWPMFKTVQSLKLAALELVRVGILADAEVARRGRDPFLCATAGAPMFFAGYLRGTSILDDPGHRVLYVFLRFFGIAAPEARQLLVDRPYLTREALRWAVYIFETAPETVTRNWAGFLRERIAAGRTTEGDVGFARWYAKRNATPAGRKADAFSVPPLQDVVENRPRFEPPRVIVRTAEAEELLESAKRIDLGLDPLDTIYVNELLAYAVEGDSLVAVSTAFLTDRRGQIICEAVGKALSQITTERIHTLRIDPYDPAVHVGAAPPPGTGPTLIPDQP